MAQWTYNAVYLKIRPQFSEASANPGAPGVAVPALVEVMAPEQENVGLTEFLNVQAAEGWDLFAVTGAVGQDSMPCFIFRKRLAEAHAGAPPPQHDVRAAAATASPAETTTGIQSPTETAPAAPLSPEDEIATLLTALDASARGNPQGWADLSFIAKMCAPSGLSADRIHELVEFLCSNNYAEWMPASESPRRGGWVRRSG